MSDTTGTNNPMEDQDLQADDSVEGHAVNHRPLDNGSSGFSVPKAEFVDSDENDFRLRQ